MSNAVLTLANISKHFHQGGEEITVLNELNLSLAAGEIASLVGPSGSGKTTLLQIAGLLDNPDSGSVTLAGEECAKLSDARRTVLRNKHLGFVFQFHQLLPELSAEENVMMPQLIGGTKSSAARTRARELLGIVKLSHRLTHVPAQLSGGEQQRVAIARALANDPAVILADEPTGNLDPETSDLVFTAFTSALKSRNASALIVTHNPDIAKRTTRSFRMEQGRVI